MSDKRMENRGILYVFPVFHSAWLAKKIREALNKLARAGSVRFFVRQKNGKQGNTVCISCFSFCVDGEKDPLSSRRRFIQSFLRNRYEASLPLPGQTRKHHRRPHLHHQKVYKDSVNVQSPPEKLGRGFCLPVLGCKDGKIPIQYIEKAVLAPKGEASRGGGVWKVT